MKKLILTFFALALCLSSFAQLTPEFTLYYNIESNAGFDEIHLWMENKTGGNMDFGAINLLVDFDDTRSTYVDFDPSSPTAVNLWYDSFNATGNVRQEQPDDFNNPFRPDAYNSSMYYQISSTAGDIYSLTSVDIPKVLVLRFQQTVSGVSGTYSFPDPYDNTVGTGNASQQFTKVGFLAGDYFFNIVSTPPASFPVEMVDFDAFQVGENTVELDWTTATEVNNAEFQVLRSMDGQFFEKIGTVQGAGNSSNLRNYSFFDMGAPQGVLYYRLRQLDLDGSFQYSETRQVTIDQAFDLNITLFPNPTTEVLNIRAHAQADRLFELRIMDSNGKVLVEDLRTSFDGADKSFNVSHYAEGSYVIELYETASGKSFSESFIIKK